MLKPFFRNFTDNFKSLLATNKNFYPLRVN